MQPTTIILRHRRENLKKCSLRGLEGKEGFRFYTYPSIIDEDLNSAVLLTFCGEPLSQKDCGKSIVLIDGTWRLAAKMEEWTLCNFPRIEKRGLPTHFRTAYPRKQTGCLYPEEGLASVEALYIAHKILGRDCEGILDNYYWKEPFLIDNFKKNS